MRWTLVQKSINLKADDKSASCVCSTPAASVDGKCYLLQVQLWPQNRPTFLWGPVARLWFPGSFNVLNIICLLCVLEILCQSTFSWGGIKPVGAYLIFQTGGHRPERSLSRYKTAWYPNNSGLCWSLCPRRLVPLESRSPEPLWCRNPSRLT